MGYWAAWPIFVPLDSQQRMVDANDPAAMTAGNAYFALPRASVPCRFCLGDGEVYGASVVPAMAAGHHDCTVLPTGGDAEMFVAADVCSTRSNPFLGKHAGEARGEAIPFGSPLGLRSCRATGERCFSGFHAGAIPIPGCPPDRYPAG